MSFDKHINFGYTTVVTSPIPKLSGTSFDVVAPPNLTPPYNMTVYPTTALPLSTNSEIVRVMGVIGNTLSVLRAQEGSVAQEINPGMAAAVTITSKVITDIEDSITSKLDYVNAGVETLPSFLDNINGSYTVGSGVYNLYTNSGATGLVVQYTLSGGSFTATDDVTNYLVANYNDGLPILQNITDVSFINNTSIIPILTLYRLGTAVDYLSWDTLANGLPNKLNRRFVKTERFSRASGLILSEQTTRYIKVSAGTIWYGANEISFNDFQSNLSGCTLREWVYNGVSWSPSIVTQFSNTAYQGATGKLELGNNKFTSLWIYKKVSSSQLLGNVVGYIFDTAQYNSLAEAAVADIPAVPLIFSALGILIGRIIVQQGVADAVKIDSAFTTSFQAGSVTNHNDLANIQGGEVGAYYHFNSNQYLNLSRFLTVSAIDTNYSISSSDYFISVTASEKIITLPSATAKGMNYIIDNASTGNITVKATGSQTIQSLTSQTIPMDCAMHVISNGINWRII